MQRHSPFLRRALLLALAPLGAAAAHAQAISGDLLGTCFDASHAAIPNAQLVATDESTNIRYNIQSDKSGEYHFVNLPIGRYDVTVTANGFTESKSIGVEVKLNQPATLDLTLAVAAEGSSVTVTEAAVTLDTTSAQIATTFQPATINDLPLASIGSGVLNMSLLNAGIQMTGGLGLGGGPSVSGERPYNNNFTIEGVDNNNKSVHAPLITVPNDAVAEFTVLQNQFSPEFGHSSGGQFNQVILSGTNQYHGRLYEYFQNRNLNAVDYSYKRSGITTNPRYDNNRFGGQLGGPVLHDKLFFFQNFEYNPIGRAGGATTILSPTTDGYSALTANASLSATNYGVLKQYLAPSPAQGTETVTFNGQQVVVPSVACVTNPAAAANDPTSSALASRCTAGNYDFVATGPLPIVAPSFTNNLTSTSSADYTINPKDSLRFRYIFFKQDTPDTSPNLPIFFGTNPTRSHLVNISEYHSVNANLTNEARFGFNRTANVTPSSTLIYPGLDTFPSFNFNDLQLQFGPDGNTPEYTIQNTYQLLDNIVWQRGKHDLRFGIEGRKVISPQSFVQRSHGDYEYSTVDLFLHDLSPDQIGERSVGVPVYYGDQISIYGYGNANWRVTQNLTLNFGARYEYTTVPYSERLQALNSLASMPGVITFDKPTSPKLNFAPRGGFAFQPTGNANFVLRGGVGLAYDVLYDNIGITTLPPELNRTEDVPDLTTQTPNFLAGGALPGGSGQLTTFPTVAAARAATSAGIVNHQLYPYSFNYNLGFSKAFARDYFAEVRYVGSRGAHLNFQDRINRQAVVTPSHFLPTYLSAPSQAELDGLANTLAGLKSESSYKPAFAAAGFDSANLTIYEPFAGSNYNGLQSQLNKRLSGGLDFQASYTYSKNLDNDSSDFYANDLDPRRIQDSNNPAGSYALSSLDRRHRLTFGGYYQVFWFSHSGNWFLKNLVGNYTVAPFYQIESAEHVTAQSGLDSNLNGDAAGDRTILNPAGVKNTGSGVTALTNTAGQTVAYLATNPNAQYIQAAVGALATAGRNTVPLPRLDNLDITVTKGVNFHERYRFEISAQAYNALNHGQFIAGQLHDVASLGGFAGNAVRPQTTTFEQWNSVFNSNARSMQLAGKFFF